MNEDDRRGGRPDGDLLARAEQLLDDTSIPFADRRIWSAYLDGARRNGVTDDDLRQIIAKLEQAKARAAYARPEGP